MQIDHKRDEMGHPAATRPERQIRAIARDLTREEGFLFVTVELDPIDFPAAGLAILAVWMGCFFMQLSKPDNPARQLRSVSIIRLVDDPIAHSRPAQEDSGSVGLGSIAVAAMAGGIDRAK